LTYRWLRGGVSRAEIALRLEVFWAAVRQWVKRRLTEVADAWRERRHPGVVAKLTTAQRVRWKKILLEGTRAHGYPTDLWTLKRLAEVIPKEFGARYTLSGGWRVLRALGFSAHAPLTRDLERGERCIRRWVRTIWPEIYRHARNTGATLPFVDEAGSQTTLNVRRAWAPAGWRPQLKVKVRWEKASIIGGVSLSGELYFDLHRNEITGTEVIWFMEQLREEIPGKVLIVWNNGRIPRCPEVAPFTWMHPDRLEPGDSDPTLPRGTPMRASGTFSWPTGWTTTARPP
jgi:transposase